MDLPNFGKLKNYVSRIDTGKNYEALIKALNDYKRELNLTSNFNETTRMFGNSSNPMFFGYCDEWIEKVGYKTKKKNNVVVMTYSKTAE